MSWLVKIVEPYDAQSEPLVGGANMAGGDPGADGAPTNNIGDDFRPGSLEAHMRWQVIWPRVVAKAWRDPDFHAALLADAETAIGEVFGYHFAASLKLVVKDEPNEVAFDVSKAYNTDNDLRTEEGRAKDPWNGLSPMELTLYLPPKPDADLQAVAITAYEDTGRTYPFTCC